jgi:hypothetical protein
MHSMLGTQPLKKVATDACCLEIKRSEGEDKHVRLVTTSLCGAVHPLPLHTVVPKIATHIPESSPTSWSCT